MKKLNVILLIFSFVLSGLGGLFLFGANASNEGLIPTNAPIVEEITEYTFKTYEDYFVDYFNIPSEIYTRDEATGKVTISYSQIARKTINGEIQLSYNGNVFYVVTSNDYTGVGSKTDPYVIHSTNGFLYLFNSLLCQVGIAYKYMKLECDLVLNDETFDKNGNPSGGDGIVYNYYCSKGYDNYTCFDGNGFALVGLYGVEKDGTAGIFTRNLFGQMCMEEVKNFNIKNSYVYGGSYSVTNFLAYRINNIYNCKALSGTVVTKGVGAAAFCRETINASNCENYIDIYSSIGEGGVGGLFTQCYSARLENLNNYGNLTVENGRQSRIGGIIQYILSSKAYIKNCNNYGIIKGNLGQNGGICSWGRGTFINCNNYGNIISGAGQIGGIVGRGDFDSEKDCLDIINCNNFGVVYPMTTTAFDGGEMVGFIEMNGNVKIYNCYADTTNAIPMYGNSAGRSMILSNCRINMKINDTKAVYLLFGMTNAGSENNITISNMHINLEKINNNQLFLFFKVAGTTINIKNIYVKSNDSYKSFKLMNNSNKDNLNIQNFIMNVKDDKSFYGTNFSGFYFSWRTGNIGLIALDGRGSFQGAIDEEWLKNNGYTKKSA